MFVTVARCPEHRQGGPRWTGVCASCLASSPRSPLLAHPRLFSSSPVFLSQRRVVIGTERQQHLESTLSHGRRIKGMVDTVRYQAPTFRIQSDHPPLRGEPRDGGPPHFRWPALPSGVPTHRGHLAARWGKPGPVPDPGRSRPAAPVGPQTGRRPAPPLSRSVAFHTWRSRRPPAACPSPGAPSPQTPLPSFPASCSSR